MGARVAAGLGDPPSIHDDGALDDGLDELPAVDEGDDVPADGDEVEPLSLPRGTAEPTVLPLDGREAGSLSRGRPRSSCAQADDRLIVSAAAASPSENFWYLITSLPVSYGAK